MHREENTKMGKYCEFILKKYTVKLEDKQEIVPQ